MAKLTLAPDSDGYTITDYPEVQSIQTEGGPPRRRLDMEESSIRIGVRWTLNETDYLYLNSFYIYDLEYGRLEFQIDLIVDSIDLVEHNAIFIPGSFKLSGVLARMYVVEAELDVEPVLQEYGYYDVAILEFEGYALHEVLQALENFSN